LWGSGKDIDVLEGDEMTESNGRCEFENQDYCCLPEWLEKSGFRCPKAIKDSPDSAFERCTATDADLMTEEEWEADQMYDKMKGSIDDWEIKGYRRR
jgi:hypothetical protein